jgi:hypothetical protein
MFFTFSLNFLKSILFPNITIIDDMEK